ncbi:hypothetical protein BOW53_12995 [Solemya pervernicosa gill symbiont]|uniref:DNA-binding response regulator n=2 Tax=Gammaproteobacteria incertae sedis TaxID=118884 RepID=A0A1T2L1X0_9GAMM|nr:response regulator transcription factor [Candidatus Reidiella endopervernicosa]OOZ39089.1 hypothetical protein BOW53_12995 [Solemya pervernicosa gill symbiont]QKQ27188.1 response regulator [Candidatus Reidiella endopervernicosa]
MQRTIAIVEDDNDQRQNYSDALERRGYRVETYADRPSALEQLSNRPPDLAILDIMLGSDVDGGFDLCRSLLAEHPELPVIFLTSRVDDIDRISGLRLGAWDYQSKPVSLAYLAERVGSLFRILDLKEGRGVEQSQQIGDLTLDEARFEASWQGEKIALTFTEFNVLKEIVDQRDGRGASYEDLANATRQGVVENNTINTHILHIRAKFRQLDKEFDSIRSVYGYGYRWSAR